MEAKESLDQWEEALEKKLQELKNCQIEKFQIESCKPNENFCENFFECEIRKSYILAVYESMNKGSGGGFEF